MVLSYASKRIPEISNEIYKIDDALRAGFGWELGPFEQADAIGVPEVIKGMEDLGHKPDQWVYDMLEKGITSFYRSEDGKRQVYDIPTGDYMNIPGAENFIVLDNYRSQTPVQKNAGSVLHDIGDGVLCFEFRSKMNSIGEDILTGLNSAIDLAEKEGWKGLVIGNDAQHFSVGANLGMIFMLAMAKDFDQLDLAIKTFQNTVMRLRYSGIPVVAAPHGMTFGGGCEMTMHADRAVAAAESYIGLVEVGVGVIPGGGGTKELVLRASDQYYQGDTEIPALQNLFMTAAQAKVSTSAKEAFGLGLLEKGNDKVTLNQSRLIADAKKEVLSLYNEGYTQPLQRTDIKVLGRQALGAFVTGIESMKWANYISEHDALIGTKLAHVFCGGDLSYPAKVSEQYLLDLEREAFLSLLTEPKTMERIQSVLQGGKPVRN